MPATPQAPARWHLRDAEDADCEDLTALCMRSKAIWGYSAEFMAACRESLTVTPEKLAAWTTVRVAQASPQQCAPRAPRDQQEILGVAATAIVSPQKPNQAEIELFFIDPAAMGRGIGRALMDDARALLVRRGVDALWILADPGAEPFYLRMGAVRVGLRPSDAISGRKLPWLRLSLAGPPVPQ